VCRAEQQQKTASKIAKAERNFFIQYEILVWKFKKSCESEHRVKEMRGTARSVRTASSRHENGPSNTWENKQATSSPAPLSRELMAQLYCKAATYRRWKQGQATKEGFRNIAQACRDGARKAKAQLELAGMSRARQRASACK